MRRLRSRDISGERNETSSFDKPSKVLSKPARSKGLPGLLLRFSRPTLVITSVVTIVQVTTFGQKRRITRASTTSTPIFLANDSKLSPLRWNGEFLDPTSSTPPRSIPLLHDNATAGPTWLRQRHQCLASIRARHAQLLGPLLLSQPKAGLLVDPAYHKNVGDHMITLGEQLFWQRLHHDETFLAECSYVQAGVWAQPCAAVIADMRAQQQQPFVALWHGGGNWGDLWRSVHDARTASLEQLLRANATVVSMPQSLYFQNANRMVDNTKQLRQSVARGLALAAHATSDHDLLDRRGRPHLFFAWREYESYQQATRLYPFATHVVLPDIAFQLGPFAPQPPPPPERVDVLLLLRADQESAVSGHDRNRVVIQHLLNDLRQSGAFESGVRSDRQREARQQRRRPRQQRITFSIVDWPDRLDRFANHEQDKQDYYFTDTAIQLLSLGRVLVCDRLHAAILAYLSGVPFVFVDPVSGKITKSLTVAFANDCPDARAGRWARAANLTHGLTTALRFLEQYPDI